ncbi:hypothetical protein HDU92_000118 [Lobulomyces angularis]|nr:hypothetical protein HDU92_000118 [Lobulomyces angularis]
MPVLENPWNSGSFSDSNDALVINFAPRKSSLVNPNIHIFQDDIQVATDSDYLDNDEFNDSSFKNDSLNLFNSNFFSFKSKHNNSNIDNSTTPTYFSSDTLNDEWKRDDNVSNYNNNYLKEDFITDTGSYGKKNFSNVKSNSSETLVFEELDNHFKKIEDTSLRDVCEEKHSLKISTGDPEKDSLISQTLYIQDTLKALLQKVVNCEKLYLQQENENDVLGSYVENLLVITNQKKK